VALNQQTVVRAFLYGNGNADHPYGQVSSHITESYKRLCRLCDIIILNAQASTDNERLQCKESGYHVRSNQQLATTVYTAQTIMRLTALNFVTSKNVIINPPPLPPRNGGLNKYATEEIPPHSHLLKLAFLFNPASPNLRPTRWLVMPVALQW
jgi:hypothetical protein